MNRILTILLIGIASMDAFPQITRTLNFRPENYRMKDTICPDNKTYTFIEGPELEFLHDVGKASLPIKTYRFLLPTGSVIDSIGSVFNDTITLQLDHAIYPVQAPTPAFIQENDDFTAPDSLFFNGLEAYPQNIATNEGTGYWHKANLLSLSICPFRYIPGKGLLDFSTSITVYISYKQGSPIDSTENTQMLAGAFANFSRDLTRMVENPESIPTSVKGISSVAALQQTENLCMHTYVAVVPDNFINTEPLNKFIDWKKRKGVDIGAVSLTQIYNYTAINYTPDDNIGNSSAVAPNNQSIQDEVAKIRKYLYTIYQNGGCQNVLLVGNQDIMPVRKYYAAHNNNPQYPATSVKTDKYFADFTSDYNVDGDPPYTGPLTS